MKNTLVTKLTWLISDLKVELELMPSSHYPSPGKYNLFGHVSRETVLL